MCWPLTASWGICGHVCVVFFRAFLLSHAVQRHLWPPLLPGWLVSGKRKRKEAAAAAAGRAEGGGGGGGVDGGGEQQLATEIPYEYNIRPSFLGGDMFGMNGGGDGQVRRRPDGGLRTEALRAGGRRVAAPQGQMPRMGEPLSAPPVPLAPPPPAPPPAGGHPTSAAVGSPGAAGLKQRGGKKGRR
jgi:hypothetical protein